MIRQRVFIQYCRVYVWAIFVEFYFAGLGAFFVTDDYHLHDLLGFGVLGGAAVMLVLTLVWRFPGNLMRMSLQLLAMNGLMLLTGVVSEEAPTGANFQRGFGAFHVVLAVGTYVLSNVIVRRAATAFRVKRPTTLFMLTSRLLKHPGGAVPAATSLSGIRPSVPAPPSIRQEPERPPPVELAVPTVTEVPALIVKNGPLAGHRVAVETELVLGRDNADVALDDDQISRSHARIRPVPGGLQIEDLGSLNGTWVNGTRIAAPTPIARGDVVGVGGVLLEVE